MLMVPLTNKDGVPTALAHVANLAGAPDVSHTDWSPAQSPQS